MRVRTLLFLVFAAALTCADGQDDVGPITQQEAPAVTIGTCPLKLSFRSRTTCISHEQPSFCMSVTIEAPEKAACEKPPVEILAVPDIIRDGGPYAIWREAIRGFFSFSIRVGSTTRVLIFKEVADIVRSSNRSFVGSSNRSIHTNKSSVQGSVATAEAEGGTNMEAGLSEGVEKRGEYIVLFSDGNSFIGEEKANFLATNLPSTPILYTIAQGDLPDFAFMQTITRERQGSFIHIPSVDDTGRVYGELRGLLQSVTHKDIQVSLNPLNGVSITSVEGGTVTNGPSGSWTVSFPEVAADEERFISVCMEVPVDNSSPTPIPADLISVEVNSIRPCKLGKDFTSGIVKAPQICPSGTIPDPMNEAATLLSKAAEDIDEALKLKMSGDIEGAVSILESLLTTLKSSSGEEFIEKLISELERILRDCRNSVVLSNGEKLRILSITSSLRNQRGFGESSIFGQTPIQQEMARFVERRVNMSSLVRAAQKDGPSGGPSFKGLD